jgi:hypothetical protein
MIYENITEEDVEKFVRASDDNPSQAIHDFLALIEHKAPDAKDEMSGILNWCIGVVTTRLRGSQ